MDNFFSALMGLSVLFVVCSFGVFLLAAAARLVWGD